MVQLCYVNLKLILILIQFFIHGVILTNISHSKLNDFFLFNLLIPSIFFGSAFFLMPVQQVFQFDTDEGIELIKAVLYSEGFTLYTKIWNEQPPLLTVLLSQWLNVFGKSILTARLLILSFSTLLIWSFCQTLRICIGRIPALVGTLLLSVSCNFMRLSVSVMFGLPSLALAMLSIYTLILYKQKSHLYLVILSGSFLALCLQTKLFTLFLIPILLFQLIDFNMRDLKEPGVLSHRFYPSLWWLVSLIGVFILIGILYNSLSFEQLFQANLGQNVKDAFPRQNSFQDILLMFLQDIDYVFLAIPGIILLLKNKSGLNKLPLIWLTTITLLLLYYQPIWYHHYLLISMPLTWLATYGATLAFEYFQKEGWHCNFQIRNIKKVTLNEIAAIFFSLSLVAIPIKLAVIQIQNHSFLQESQINNEVLASILKYKKHTHWVFTDLPIYAFYADLNVPPEIAVFARKRLASGYLTEELLTSVIKRYHPEQVILGRFPEIQNYLGHYLQENYSKIYEQKFTKHYLLPGLSRD